MAERINRAIELLEQDQPIYYIGRPFRARADLGAGPRGRQTWADYINVGMEHGAFDMTGSTSTCAAWSTAGRPRAAIARPR